MSKPSKFLLTALLLGVILPGLVMAASIGDTLNTAANDAGFGTATNAQTNFAQTAGNVIKVFLSILGTMFMIYTFYGGYQWIMARGNEENMTKAKAIIRGSITGIIIVLVAYAISAFILDQVSKSTLQQSSSQTITSP
jgi:uncharacterized membrane protein